MNLKTISSPASQPPSDSSFMRQEQVRRLYMQAPVSNSVVIIISILYYFLLHPYLDSTLLSVWTLLLITTGLYRIFLWHRRKTAPESRSPASWLHHYMAGCALVGGAWSPIYAIIPETTDPFIMVSLLMLGFGVISSAVPILSVYIPAFLVYILPQGLVLIFSFLCFDDSTYIWLAAAIGIYLAMTILFAMNTNRNILQAIGLLDKNESLINTLNLEITQREALIDQRTVELKKKNENLIAEIKEREYTQRRLQQTNSNLDATLRAIPDLLFEFDKDGTYKNIWANNQELLAAQKEVLLGRTVTKMLPEDAANLVMAAIKQAISEGTSHSQVISLPLDDGIHWFELSTSRKEEADGTRHVLMLSRDITDKHLMQTELLRIRKLESIGILAGGIAHDFNNILSAIIGFTELAKTNIPPDCQGQEDLDTVLTASKRAADLIQQILTFSSKSQHDLQSFMPHLIVAEALKMLRSSLPRTISLEEDVDSDCGAILADPTKFHQIIVNLCTNAFQSMENEKGTLSVSLYRQELTSADIHEAEVSPGPFVVLSVQDTGHGMDDETIERIFEPYFTMKEVGKGSGLGLAVVHGIVKDHKGFIRVESTPGLGSVFRVYLPALEKNISPPKIPEKTYHGGSGKILLVDDEAMILKFEKTVLEQCGYEVTAETDSVMALEIFRSNPDNFDLIITDQTMFSLSGVELAKEVLKIRPRFPIILCSGYSSMVSEDDVTTLKIRKYLKKPFEGSTLATVVREVLDGQNKLISNE